MSQFNIQLADSTPCFHCGEDMPLDVSLCGACEQEVPLRVSVVGVLDAITRNEIVDVRAGGLVLGRHSKEDDIPMYRAVARGIFQLTGLMQGGEFILNWKASEENADRLRALNSYTGEYERLTSIPLTDTTRVFNTNGTAGSDSDLSVWVDSRQFVINRAATIKYYSELEEINNSVSPWKRTLKSPSDETTSSNE